VKKPVVVPVKVETTTVVRTVVAGKWIFVEERRA
jgi:hypothetical protein